MEIQPPQPDWLSPGIQDNTLELTAARYPSIQWYSNALLDLIEECLSFEQSGRPTFRHILDHIYGETSEGRFDGNRANGMRSGSATVATRAQEAVHLFPDTYYMGLTRANLDMIPP